MTLPLGGAAARDPQPETLSARSEREINLVIRTAVRYLGRREGRKRGKRKTGRAGGRDGGEGGGENKHVPVLKRSS